MMPPEFFRRFKLHDSVVEEAHYSGENHTLTLKLELPSYMQPSYKQGASETIAGGLVFSGVERLMADPELASFAWGPNVNGEILQARLLPSDDSKHLHHVKLVSTISNYREKRKTILNLDFLTTDIQWNPEQEKIRPSPSEKP